MDLQLKEDIVSQRNIVLELKAQISKLSAQLGAHTGKLVDMCTHDRVVMTRIEGNGCNDHVNRGRCLICGMSGEEYDGCTEEFRDKPMMWVDIFTYDEIWWYQFSIENLKTYGSFKVY